VGIAQRTLDQVSPDPDAALELLRDSVALLEPSRARLEHAYSLVALGSALRRRRHRIDAVRSSSAEWTSPSQFVSTRTVETHLRCANQKLDIATRAQLSGALTSSACA
jgi:hypothetical protein